MEIRYRITPQELARWHRLNRTGVMARWWSYLLVAAALLPSVVALVWLESFYASLWMAMALVVMLGYSVASRLFGASQLGGYECVDRLTNDGKLSTFSRSQAQVAWHRYEELSETKSDFLFWHLGRCSMIPKRALEALQLQQIGQWLESVRAQPAGDVPALPLYEAMLADDNPHPIIRYQYTADDVAKILKTSFQPYEYSSFDPRVKPAGKQVSWSRLIQLFGFGLVVGYLVISLPRLAGLPGTSIRDLLICLAPFLILGIFSKIVWSRSRRKPPQVPTGEVLARLSEEGIFFGDSESLVFYHWSDVDAFYQNQDFIGFKTVNYLINLLPKRVLGDEQKVGDFMVATDELKRNVAKADLPTVHVPRPESDNPYQSPLV